MGNIITKLSNEDLIRSVLCIPSNSSCITGVALKRTTHANTYRYMVLINKSQKSVAINNVRAWNRTHYTVITFFPLKKRLAVDYLNRYIFFKCWIHLHIKKINNTPFIGFTMEVLNKVLSVANTL